MTKLKNTKKGMAKKALSISLVAAMLATSNVPVWAAEDLFTDGSGVAVQTQAAEDADVFTSGGTQAQNAAPAAVVEEAGEAPALASAVVQNGVTVDLAADKTEVVWGDDVAITGTVTRDGQAVIAYKYAWKDADQIAAVSGNQSGIATLTTTKEHAGKTLTLWVYAEDDFNINTGIAVTVKKKALTAVTSSKTFTYNGFDQSFAAADVDRVDSGGTALTPDEYTLSFVPGKNAGDKVTVTATAADTSAYEGSFSKTVEIGKKDMATKDVAVTVKDNLEYQYTGAAIEISKGDVTLKESESADDGADGNLGGADLSSAIDTVETAAGKLGDQTVKVTVKPDELKNFTAIDTAFVGNVIAGGADETVKVVVRDLANNCTISPTGYIPTGTDVSATDLAPYLDFTDGETELSLTPGTDYTVTAKDENGAAVTELSAGGKYTLTISGAGNTKNDKTVNVEVVKEVITKVEGAAFASYKPYYTGSEIKPSKTDIGALTITSKTQGAAETTETLQPSQWEITGYANNTNANTYDGAKPASVSIKLNAGNFKDQIVTLNFTIQGLTVAPADVTVPETVTYNQTITDAEDYQIPVAAVAKGDNGKISKGLTEKDYTIAYAYTNTSGKTGNEKDNTIQATIAITNPNYFNDSSAKKKDVDAAKTTKIVSKTLTSSMVSVNPSSYTYTGGTITPEFAVMDGVYLLEEGQDYTIQSITNAVNAGTGKIKIKGVDKNYYGTVEAEFAITAANTSDVKVEIPDAAYTGKQIRPSDFVAKLNGNAVTNQFVITGYGANTAEGKGTVTLEPVSGNKNFTGGSITAEFNIVSELVKGTIKVYDQYGVEVTPDPSEAETFDGTAKTYANAVLSGLTKDPSGATKATAADFEIKYADNVTGSFDSGKSVNVAYVYAVAKEGSGFAGKGTITTSDGTVIKGVVAKTPIYIKAVEFVKQNVTVKNGTYAGGLPVKPEILIQIGGNTLVEGKDYEVTLKGADAGKNYTEVTTGKPYTFSIAGINGYKGSTVAADNFNWGIDKKNIADCTVTVTAGVASVTNGPIPVPAAEYTVKDNGDKTYTVTAASASKNYTGSKTVTGEGQKPADRPVAPTIQQVNVSGNKATVVLAGDTEGSTGYDYVISKSNVFTDKASRVGVNANILSTQTSFQYVGQGVYYAYLHSWKRVDGKKVFSEWSNAYPFMVSAITPDQPAVTSVKVSGSTVKVTYTKSANATGYDIVLGSAVKKVNGEKRPVSYGKLVKKVYKGSTVTVTFTKVPKGTYYAGLHAYNRTSENGKKVFSPWSNSPKLTVK